MSPLFYRLLKWTILTALGLTLLVVVGFSVFVMNPLEGRLASLDAIVPAEVNLYAAKEVADEEARGFLLTPFWRRLTATEAYQLWVRSPRWRRSGLAAGLQTVLAELRVVESAYRVDPLAEVASREVGFALRFKAGEPDFLLFLRLSFGARAYVALLQHAVFRDLMNLPVEAVPDSELLAVHLRDGSRTRDLYLTRLRDVLVVGSSADLVTATRRLAAGAARGFLARMGPRPGGPGNPIGIVLTPEPGHHAARWATTLVPSTLDELTRLFMEAIDPAGLTSLKGRFFLGRSPHLAVEANFHAGSLRPLQNDLQRAPATDIHEAMSPFLDLAPRDLMAFLYLHLPPRQVAAHVEDALAPETRQLVEDTLRPTALRSLHHLLDRWLGRLEPGFALYLNRQHFERPPANWPWFGFTLAFRMRDTDLWQRILHHDLLDHLKDALTITDFHYEAPRPDVELIEYRFRANPYGDVSTPAFARFGHLVAFSSSADFLRRMADTYLDASRYGLRRSGEVERLFTGARPLPAASSLFVFLDVRRSLKWVDDAAPYWARAQSLRTQLQSAAGKRRALEFQARRLRQLRTAEDREAWVDEQMDRWERSLRRELERRIERVVGPIVQHLGVLHTVGLALGPGGKGGPPRVRLAATFNFNP